MEYRLANIVVGITAPSVGSGQIFTPFGQIRIMIESKDGLLRLREDETNLSVSESVFQACATAPTSQRARAVSAAWRVTMETP